VCLEKAGELGKRADVNCVQTTQTVAKMQTRDTSVAKAIVPSLEIHDLNVFPAYDLTRYGTMRKGPRSSAQAAVRDAINIMSPCWRMRRWRSGPSTPTFFPLQKRVIPGINLIPWICSPRCAMYYTLPLSITPKYSSFAYFIALNHSSSMKVSFSEP
jgi:hypothetical protein